MAPRRALAVPAQDSERVLQALHAARCLDPTRRTRREGGEVLIPILPDVAVSAEEMGGRLVEDAALPVRETRLTPKEAVAAGLPPELRDAVPDKWELVGEVLVLRLPGELRPHATVVARAFADVLGAKSVLEDRAGVSGELREMALEPLLGSDFVATHVENAIRYRFDASKIMFSSGNVHERTRVAKLPARGETVVDMFAGIGYFTLPLALHAGAARVIAIEKNPASHRWLAENARLNGVDGIVEPWLGDNREYPGDAIADRVMMGYLPHTERFLPTAMRLVKRGGLLHFHNTAGADAWQDELMAQVFDAAMDKGWGAEVLLARIVKTHSPGVVHAVLDVRVG